MLQLVPNKKIILTNTFIYKKLEFISSSPCIIKDPNNRNNFLILNRCNHNFNHKMVNQIIKVDNNFNVLETKIIEYNFVNDLRCYGFEDIRLFVYNDSIYYIGVFRNGLTSYTLVTDIFENEELNINKISITFTTDYNFEKNWVFFDYKSKLCVIYRWFPLQICEIDYEKKQLHLIEELIMPIFFTNIFGSSCGVLYDNHIWFIAHTHENRNYSHILVAFNENMKLIKYSEYFKFEVNREFSYGLFIEDDHFIITYSTNNSTSNISIFDYYYIQNNITWVYANQQ